ncbi:hypothetical protein [Tessaracoccus sp. ZS01]|uniref:hypothetical protein n=1 Tax=Tessaracoccus sp. ZS01 TaxID=1906324 RepID=UPI00096DAF1E|nr:hypothetical protein [Tessaracoccus sp. ZS01]MCG6568037.1 hypothetical protein [Tessaracoccus sp. ZS01]OMG54297.1 hypothetical protein BJN44_10480 [Tessaracoccus sp. ZS01]
MQTEADWQKRAEDNDRLRRGILRELDAAKDRLAQEGAAKADLLELSHKLAEDLHTAHETIDELRDEIQGLRAEADDLRAQTVSLAEARAVASMTSGQPMPAKLQAVVSAYRRLPKPLRRGVNVLSRPLIRSRGK